MTISTRQQLINDELSKSVADQRKELLASFLEQRDKKKKKSKKKKKNKTGGGAKAGSGDADGDDPQQPKASSTDEGGSSETYEMRKQSNGDIFFVSKSSNSIVHIPANDDGSSVYLDQPLTPEEQQAQEVATSSRRSQPIRRMGGSTDYRAEPGSVSHGTNVRWSGRGGNLSSRQAHRQLSRTGCSF